ncbi:MAG TPA: sigma-70 family RNA polymerase sigma factor [Pyrinomonadaceae bacterium]|nr:sigma-70 family RNA polymerase sigma factor [Pyrinomonadaceae bacterium]
MAGSEPAQKARLGRMDETEERRMVEAAQRDRACFADVYERYFELVYAYVVRRVGDRAATEDLTSEVFRRALANIERFKWTGAPFGAWLLRIAANLIADQAKREAKEASGESSTIEPLPELAPAARELQQVQLEAAERRAWVIRLVDELPEDQRRVVKMRFGEEKSINEIAVELGRSEGAVKQLQFRAFQNLRAKLAIK